MRLQGDDWSRKLPIEARILLMQLMNIEAKVVKGDTASTASENVSSKNVSLRELFEQKPILDGRRTEVYWQLIPLCYWSNQLRPQNHSLLHYQTT